MPTDRKPRHVLDPEWEESLRRGQEAEGDAGSVERELEVVHLLRHLREPEPLSDARFDAIMAELSDAAGEPSSWVRLTSWIRKRWYVWATPLAATAVLLLVVVVPGGPGNDTVAAREASGSAAKHEELAAKSDDVEASVEGDAEAASAAPRLAMAERSAQAEAIEKQFEILEAKARAEVDRSVESGRAATRTGLFDLAKSAGTAATPPAEPARPASAEPAIRSKATSGAQPAARPAAQPAADPAAVDQVDAFEGGGGR